MSDEDELSAIRRRRAADLQRQLADAQTKETQRQQVEAQRSQALREILTPEARDRLNNLKLARPELAEQIESQLIMLAQSGRIPRMLSDADLKQLLAQMTEKKREPKIEFR